MIEWRPEWGPRPEPPRASVEPPDTFGWLRRPELDPPTWDGPLQPCAWERPDGEDVYLAPGTKLVRRAG